MRRLGGFPGLKGAFDRVRAKLTPLALDWYDLHAKLD